jgi:hypothetical protein
VKQIWAAKSMVVVIAATTGLAMMPATMSQAASPNPAVRTVAATATPHAHKATLKTFAGTWVGHTRGLAITRKGRAKEAIGDGCCDPVITLRFRLSHVRGTTHRASARARVTAVHVHDRRDFPKGSPPPHKGEVRRIRLKHGVITERLTKTTYCDMKAAKTGVCGA